MNKLNFVSGVFAHLLTCVRKCRTSSALLRTHVSVKKNTLEIKIQFIYHSFYKKERLYLWQTMNY